jgi:hypothetical protein
MFAFPDRLHCFVPLAVLSLVLPALQSERSVPIFLPFPPHIRGIIPKIIPQKLAQVAALLNRQEEPVSESLPAEPESDAG